MKEGTHVTRIRVPLLIVLLGAFALPGCTEGDPSNESLAGCEPSWSFPTLESGVLTVAAVASLPALHIDPASGEATGIEADLLEEFARESCLEIDWQALSGPAGVAAMTEGRADVGAGGWWISDERGESIGQSAPIWYDYTATLARSKIAALPELGELRVGVEGGSVYEEPLTSMSGQGTVQTYQSIDAMLQDLSADRLDAVIATSSQLGYQANVRGMDGYEFTVLPPDQNFPALTDGAAVNFPFTKGNDELGDALNAFIESAREDGTVQKLLSDNGLDDSRNFTG